MSVINEYINIEKEYKINLDSNEIYLNINENILMKMKSCLTQIDLHRYPTNDMQEIKKLYAKYADTDPKNIIVGNGSDEAIDLVISSVIRQGKKVLSLNPDFVMYDFYVTRFGGEIKTYNIGESMKFNVDEFIEMGKNEDIDMIIFSNPNNPTGIGIKVEDILKVIEVFKDKPVVVDEAYYEFYGETVISYINEYKNLYVTRTLSKAWGLAALRLGFLITNEENVKELLKFKVPYTISSYSQNLASVVLRYPDRVIENAKKVVEQRELLFSELNKIQKNAAMHIEFYPSKGNFIYGKTSHKEALEKGLIKDGISIRYFNGDVFRITVGSPMENRKVVESIKNIFVY